MVLILFSFLICVFSKCNKNKKLLLTLISSNGKIKKHCDQDVHNIWLGSEEAKRGRL